MARKKKFKRNHLFNQSVADEDAYQTYYEKKEVKPLTAITLNQQITLDALNNPEKKLIFLTGYARTGKTYLPTAFAADELRLGNIKKLVLTRPCKEAGDSIGFLPGTEQDKLSPYVRPAKEVLEKRLGAGTTKAFINNNTIEGIPIGFLRSYTFHDSFIIFDEAQNVDFCLLELLLTRIGNNSRIVVAGDYKRQKDIKYQSGLSEVVKILKNKPYVAHIDFSLDDIVYPLIKDLVSTFHYYDKQKDE